MASLKSSGDDLKSQHTSFLTRIGTLLEDLSSLDSKLASSEQLCYTNKHELCLTHYDNYQLASLDLSRKYEKLERDKTAACWVPIPYSLRPAKEFDWHVTTADVLSQYQQFFACAKPYYEQKISLLQEKVELKKSVLHRLNEFKFNS
jgi:hypothetical protein